MPDTDDAYVPTISFLGAWASNGVSIASTLPQTGGQKMPTERRKSPRYPFAATAEIIDEKENARSSSQVSDLSMQGCYVEMANPFPQGTNVMVEIYTDTDFMEAHATVAFLEPKQGMGLAFHDIQPCFSTVLNKWLGKASGRKTSGSKTLSDARA